MAAEAPGHSLQPTALVHEAYLRLVGDQRFDHRGHFFAAAAEAMRRILVDKAREKASGKHGGSKLKVDLDQLDVNLDATRRADDLLALDDAIEELTKNDPISAQLVKLRYFACLSHQEAAEALGITRRAADRNWAVARAWLYQHLTDS